MSESPAPKKSNVDKVLLGTAGALILGLFVFGKSDKKPAEAQEEQVENEEAAENMAPEGGAQIGAVIGALPPKVEISAEAKKIAALEAKLKEIGEKNQTLAKQLAVSNGALGKVQDRVARLAGGDPAELAKAREEMKALSAKNSADDEALKKALAESQAQIAALKSKVNAAPAMKSTGAADPTATAEALAAKKRYDDLVKRLQRSLKEHEEMFGK